MAAHAGEYGVVIHGTVSVDMEEVKARAIQASSLVTQAS
jgi:hypothetical protein